MNLIEWEFFPYKPSNPSLSHCRKVIDAFVSSYKGGKLKWRALPSSESVSTVIKVILIGSYRIRVFIGSIYLKLQNTGFV